MVIEAGIIILTFACGVALGLYIASQVSGWIDRNIDQQDRKDKEHRDKYNL